MYMFPTSIAYSEYVFKLYKKLANSHQFSTVLWIITNTTSPNPRNQNTGWMVCRHRSIGLQRMRKWPLEASCCGELHEKLQGNSAFLDVAGPPIEPRDERYICLHEWWIFMVNVGKYTIRHTWILWVKKGTVHTDTSMRLFGSCRVPVTRLSLIHY